MNYVIVVFRCEVDVNAIVYHLTKYTIQIWHVDFVTSICKRLQITTIRVLTFSKGHNEGLKRRKVTKHIEK